MNHANNIYEPKIFISDHYQIVALICFTLEQVGEISENALTEALTAEGIVRILDLSGAFGTVERKDLASFRDENGERLYTITEAGRLIAKEGAGSLPLLVKSRAVESTKRLLNVAELKRTANWRILLGEDGFAFELTLLNEMTGGKIMSYTLFAADEAEAKAFEQRFLDNPSRVLKRLITALSPPEY
jgi:hypothetical protein